MESCFFSICNPIFVGCAFYQNNTATTLVTDGFYSDGVYCYEVVGGIVITVSTCGGVTPSCTLWLLKPSDTIDENTNVKYIDCSTGLPAEINVAYSSPEQTFCASSITGYEGGGALIDSGTC